MSRSLQDQYVISHNNQNTEFGMTDAAYILLCPSMHAGKERFYMKNDLSKANQPNDYEHASGKLIYNMTNNYMFMAILQSNEYALRGLIASLLHMSPDEIKSIEYLNQIEVGKYINLKEYILDVNLNFNNNNIMNLEMQVRKYCNWVPRSISYLCREWDKLDKGIDYEKASSAYHIGFLDHTLFADRPKFYATYRLCDIVDNYQYSSRFNLSVVELNNIEMATDKDKAFGIDEWARMFKATTWEEIKMLAEKNTYIDSAAREMFVRGQDNKFIDLCRKTEEEIAGEEYRRMRIAELESVVADKDAVIAALKVEIEQLKASQE